MLNTLGVHDLPLFLVSGLVLNLIPGPDMLYMAGSTAMGGRRAGLLAGLGIASGCLVHVLLSALGLSALLAASEQAFNIVKWVGAAYLMWMGLGMLRSRAMALPPSEAAPASTSGRAAPPFDMKLVYWRGLLTNALNPKVALFFVAFLPQFIDPQTAHRELAFLSLGLLFTVNGMLVLLGVAWLAGAARDRLMAAQRNGASRLARWFQRGAGALFIAFGMKLALVSR